MNRLPRSAYLILVVLCSCRPGEPDVSTVVPGQPFEQLVGVRLGMTARSLRDVRPDVTEIPYGGFNEVVDSFRVAYRFSGAGQSIDPGARLNTIMVQQHYGNADSALRRLREITGSLATRFGSPRCIHIPPETTGRVAAWSLDDLYLEVYARDPMSDGVQMLPFRAGYLISTDSVTRSAEEPIPC